MCERGLVHSIVIFIKKKYYKSIINKSTASLWTIIFQKKIAFREIYYMFSQVTEWWASEGEAALHLRAVSETNYIRASIFKLIKVN